MSRFVNRLIQRQTATSQVVTPRLRSKFEPEAIPSQGWAMDSIVKAGGEQEPAPGVIKENVPSFPVAAGRGQGDRAKEESGQVIRTEERPVKASGRSTDIPEAPVAGSNKEQGRQEQPEEKKKITPPQQPAKWETAVTKPNPEAASEETGGKQNIGHGKRDGFETVRARQDAREEGIPRKKITAYEPQPATPVKIETRPREEALQGRGQLGEAVASGKKSVDPSIASLIPEPAPLIRINIGRIEVHAVHPPPVQPVRTQPTPKPKLSLDDFLKKRNEL